MKLLKLVLPQVVVKKLVDLPPREKYGASVLAQLHQPETDREIWLVCAEKCAPSIRMAHEGEPINVEVSAWRAPRGESSKGRSYKMIVTGLVPGGETE